MDKKNTFTKLLQSCDEDFKLSDYTVDEIEIMMNVKKNNKQKFKDNYFAYYDDVKSSSLKKQDW